MKPAIKLSVGVAIIAITAGCMTSPVDEQNQSTSRAYLQDGRGNVARNAYGQCWRTGFWTSADAIPECEDMPAKQPAIMAPPVVAPQVVAPKTREVAYQTKALFDFDRATVKPDSKMRLDALVDDLQGVDVEWVIVIGHADATGSVAYNQKLSERRAEAVKAYLISKGVDANKIRTEGKGETQPVADNATRAGRAMNRRVTVEVVSVAK